MNRLRDYCEIHLTEILADTEAFARRESPSTDKGAVDRCGEDIAARCRAAGAEIRWLRREDRGNHILASWPGHEPAILLLGHFDTVWPLHTIAEMPVARDGDRLTGPGVFDMKAGIAVALAAMRALKANDMRHPAIRMLWTTDEEIGSATSRGDIEAFARLSRAVLVLEPSLPGGALKTARKGCGQYDLIVDGVAAHAGLDPAKGVSAIHELATQIREIEQLTDLSTGVTVNVGIVEGGTRPNVVAARARAVIDARALTVADAERVDHVLRRLQPMRAGARLTLQGGFERPPMERSPEIERLFELARDVAGELGRTLEEGSAGGGSDGNFTAALGVPTLDGLGAVGDGAHASHEHVIVSELPWRAALVAGLLSRL
ncbi:MAG TPA: M20 family metallopeptidase [Vicinamibacterales bacterium]|nr:M20 family metallopeptidase [Vicinamibacterales bacterium]